MILSTPLTPAQKHPTGQRYTLSEAVLAKFEQEVEKFPADQRQSAVMACLSIVQFEHGFVSEAHELEVAQFLEMPAIAVHEVATFYNMYNLSPVGRYKLNVCTNLSCLLKGGEDALAHACKRLNVQPGGTTADGLFTVQAAECLGACADAPVVLVNDRSMCSFMSSAKLDELIDGLTTLKEST
jgi:NADH-quinone oxidoreductase subunit E